MDEIEEFWDNVLSRQPGRVLAACASLTAADLERLKAHLADMAAGEGWHMEQRLSAQAALDALNSKTAGKAD